MTNAGSLQATISLGGLDAVERQLQRFSRSMNDIGSKASKMGKNLRDAGDSLNEVGENIAPLSAGLLAIGGASVMASDNINQAMNNFKTKLGASGDELAKYETVMHDVASTGVGSFDEVSNSIVDITKNMKGLSTGEMANVTEEAMQLAKVMQSDVSEVSKTAGQLMKQFGISSQEAMDMMAKGYQKNMDFAGDYQDTLSEYSVYFKSLGFDAEDMFNVLAEGAEKGAFNLDKVGDAVKEFGIRSKDGSKTSMQAFKDLGLNADKMTDTFAKGGEGAKKAYAKVVEALTDVDDQTKRNEIGVALFGTQYEDMEKDVIASTGTIVDHLGDYGGTASQLAEDNKSFAQQMQGAWNEIQEAIKPVGDIMRQFISDIMPPLVSGIKTLASAFTGLSPTMQKVVLAFGAFIAFLPVMLIGLGSVMTVAGTFMSGIGAISKGFSLLSKGGVKLIGMFKNIGKAFLTLSRFFMANPFMLIITAIIVVAVLIYKYWDEIVATTKKVWSALVEWFTPLWDGFKEIVANVVDWMIGAWESFKSGFMAVLTSVGNFFVSVWEGLKSVFMTVWNTFVSYVTTVFGIIQTIIQTAWNVIKTIFLIALGILLTILSPLWNAFATGWNAMIDIVTVVLEAIKSWVSSAITFLIGLWNKFKSFMQSLWNAVYSNVIAPVIGKIKALIKAIIEFVKFVFNTIKNTIKSIWDAIYSNVIKPVIDKIKSIINSLISKVNSVMSSVKTGFTVAWNFIRNLVQSIIDKVVSIIQKVYTKAKEVGNNVKTTLTEAFNTVKSKVTDAVDSVKKKVQSIWDKAKDVASNIKEAFANLFGKIKVPSFSLGGWSVKDLPKMPKMSIKWHAKGGILDSSTLIGAGEKGAEAIVPLSSQRRMKPFAQAVSKFMPENTKSGGDTNIHVAQLVVREDADITKVAQELNRLKEKKERARGKISFA